MFRRARFSQTRASESRELVFLSVWPKRWPLSNLLYGSENSKNVRKSQKLNTSSFYKFLSLFSLYWNALNILLCNYNRMCFAGQGFPRAEHWKAENLSFFQYDPRDGPYQISFTDQKTLKMSEKVRNGKHSFQKYVLKCFSVYCNHWDHSWHIERASLGEIKYHHYFTAKWVCNIFIVLMQILFIVPLKH